jgi:hypothetical protein
VDDAVAFDAAPADDDEDTGEHRARHETAVKRGKTVKSDKEERVGKGNEQNDEKRARHATQGEELSRGGQQDRKERKKERTHPHRKVRNPLLNNPRPNNLPVPPFPSGSQPFLFPPLNHLHVSLEVAVLVHLCISRDEFCDGESFGVDGSLGDETVRCWEAEETGDEGCAAEEEEVLGVEDWGER